MARFSGMWLAYAEIFWNRPIVPNGWCRFENLPESGVHISGLFAPDPSMCNKKGKRFAHGMGFDASGKILNKYCTKRCVPCKILEAYVIKNNRIELKVVSPEAKKKYQYYLNLNGTYTKTLLECRRDPERCRNMSILFGVLSAPHYFLYKISLPFTYIYEALHTGS